MLEGKNLLVEARTGSGKTAACLLPIIDRILLNKRLQQAPPRTTCLFMAPTKELCSQVDKVLKQITAHCRADVSTLNVAAHNSADVLAPLLADQPDLVVGTPARLLGHARAGHLLLTHLSTLVIDEADLLFGLGYEPDLKALRELLPASYQAVLMSATLGPEIKALRRVLLHGAAWVRLELPEDAHLPPAGQLLQYVLRCQEEDKFVLLLALCKLRLVRGKTLVFLNSVDRCYRLKLFLEHFSVRAVILNSELPVASRVHVVQQFNHGLYDILLASDEQHTAAPGAGTSSKSTSSRHKRERDPEYGVSRGIDFHLVSNVLNFDFPKSALSYIHRVGRTARADNKGTALSFVSSDEAELLALVEASLSETGRATATATQDGGAAGATFSLRPFEFRMEEVDGFRYRAKDAMRAVTKTAVRAARLKEIKTEMLNSAKIRSYLEDNQRDLVVLRHDKELASRALQLGNVPDYLVPDSLRGLAPSAKSRRRTAAKIAASAGDGTTGPVRKRAAFGGGVQKRRNARDPLRTFRVDVGSKSSGKAKKS